MINSRKEACDILGISVNSTMADIKSAYKNLAKKYHPDVNQKDENAEEKFKQISAAYHLLLDKFSRLPNYM